MQTKAQKEVILKKLVENMKQAKSVVFADYQGVSVKDLSKLRNEMRKEGVHFDVAKKTLFRIAAKESGYQDIPDDVIEGPVGAAFCMEDETAGARLIYQAGKKNENLKLRGALFEGKVLSVADTKVLATLPTKHELLSKFVYLVKYPIQGFHDVLQNTIGGFVRVLGAIKDKNAA